MTLQAERVLAYRRAEERAAKLAPEAVSFMHSATTPLTMPAQRHEHDGRCSGRMRREAGRLVLEVVCDDCGTVVSELGGRAAYRCEPREDVS